MGEFMWSINYNLKKMIHVKSDYEYITSIKVYVPYKEIGINALIRKEQQLPFIYEIILKMVNFKIKSVTEISYFTGIEEEILYDIIAEMCRLDLIYPISNEIIITEKGLLALKNLIQVTIEKQVINRIFIDLLNGNIVEKENLIGRIPYNCSWINVQKEINSDFLERSFNKIDSLYKERQAIYQSGGSSIGAENEIYQILDILYDKSWYEEKTVLIYKNLLDGDICFEPKIEEDEEYVDEFRKQIKDFYGARQFLKSNRYINSNLKESINWDKEKRNALDELVQIVVNEDKERLSEFYFKDRYLYDNELKQILIELKNIKPTYLVIHTNKLGEIMDDNVIGIMHNLLDRCKVLIVADRTEYKIKDIVSKFKNIKNKKNQIEIMYKEDIDETKILIYPYALIKQESIKVKVDKDYLITDISEITFNKKLIEKEKNSYIENKE
jgi:hypothetical protein